MDPELKNYKNRISFKLEKISPKKARKYLKRNHRNRDLDPKKVESLSEIISSGRWKVINHPIGFDQDGNLIDGQHRLNAVVLSETPIISAVMRGMDGHD